LDSQEALIAISDGRHRSMFLMYTVQKLSFVLYCCLSHQRSRIDRKYHRQGNWKDWRRISL